VPSVIELLISESMFAGGKMGTDSHLGELIHQSDSASCNFVFML
jgi:hypothetical protein